MTEANKANEIADQGSVDAWTDHIFRAPIFLTKNIGIVSSSAVIVLGGMIMYWGLDKPEDSWGLGVVTLSSIILGILLGYRAHRLNVVRPIGTAFGVAWRIGVVWIVLAAFAESVADPPAIATQASFPLLLLLFIVIIAGAFTIGYMADVIRSGVANMSVQNLTFLILALAGIAATLFFGVRSVDLRENGQKRSEEQQSERIKQMEEMIKLLQKQNENAEGRETFY